MNADVQFIVSNALTATVFILLLVQTVQSQRKSMLVLSVISMGLLVITYLITACWSAAVTTLFSMAQPLYEARAEAKSRTPRRAAELVFTLISALVAGIIQVAADGINFFSALPIVSTLISGFGTFHSTNANQLRIKSGVGALLWIVFSLKNQLYGSVLSDLVKIGAMIASIYLDKFDPDDGYWLQKRIYLKRYSGTQN